VRAVDDPAPAARPASDRLLTRDFVVLTVSAFFAMCGFSATLPLVPRYVEGELGGSKLAVGIAVGVFSLSAVVARPLVGRLGDERGRRYIIVGGTALTAVTVAAHALATTIPLLYAVRLAMGVTQGAFFVGTATLVNDLAPVARRGEATNYFSVAVYGGMAFGPLLGETVQSAGGFALAFAAAGAALLLASALALRLPRDRPAPGLAAGGGVAAGAGRRILIHRAAVAPGLVLMLGLVTFTALNGFMPLYVEEHDLGRAGTVLLVYGLLVLVMRIVGSKLPDRFGTRRMAAISLAGQAAGMFVMGLWISPIGLYAGAVVLAVGGSFLYPTMLTAAVYGVADHERARATSTFTLAFELSSGVGGPLLGLAAALAGNQATFLVSGLFAVLGLPVLFGWSARRPEALVPAQGRAR
jgi:MFS family permease